MVFVNLVVDSQQLGR